MQGARGQEKRSKGKGEIMMVPLPRVTPVAALFKPHGLLLLRSWLLALGL
jgi:hypothetical protein